MDFLTNFLKENKLSGGLAVDSANAIKNLVDRYKLPSIENGTSLITADFGNLGSINIRDVDTFEPKDFKYESGDYDYVSIVSKGETFILWTDYSNVEPYNRNGGLYANGASFRMLGEPVVEKEDYREFIKRLNVKSNVSFAISGFSHNTHYNSVKFGLCIKTDKVDEFLKELRTILNK